MSSAAAAHGEGGPDRAARGTSGSGHPAVPGVPANAAATDRGCWSASDGDDGRSSTGAGGSRGSSGAQREDANGGFGVPVEKQPASVMAINGPDFAGHGLSARECDAVGPEPGPGRAAACFVSGFHRCVAMGGSSVAAHGAAQNQRERKQPAVMQRSGFGDGHGPRNEHDDAMPEGPPCPGKLHSIGSSATT